MIARRNQRAVDDPQGTSIAERPVVGKRGETWDQIGQDAMYLRRRDGEHRSELAKGEVGAQLDANDEQPARERQRPRATSTTLGGSERRK
jgi:hypothetical protein